MCVVLVTIWIGIYEAVAGVLKAEGIGRLKAFMRTSATPRGEAFIPQLLEHLTGLTRTDPEDGKVNGGGGVDGKPDPLGLFFSIIERLRGFTADPVGDARHATCYCSNWG